MTAEKHALRARLRAQRDVFFASAPAGITPPPRFLSLLKRGLTVTSYVPVGAEADPSLLARAAVERDCRIALPHVTTRDRPMRFLAWATEAALIAGPFGLHQPAHDADALAPDIILTPLLGFDRAGNRLGQGAGYYDRAFAHFPDAWRIGVAWSVQEVESIPTDAWDMPLHAVITEREWIVIS